MAPFLDGLHPYAAHRLVKLFELLSKKYERVLMSTSAATDSVHRSSPPSLSQTTESSSSTPQQEQQRQYDEWTATSQPQPLLQSPSLSEPVPDPRLQLGWEMQQIYSQSSVQPGEPYRATRSRPQDVPAAVAAAVAATSLSQQSHPNGPEPYQTNGFLHATSPVSEEQVLDGSPRQTPPPRPTIHSTGEQGSVDHSTMFPSASNGRVLVDEIRERSISSTTAVSLSGTETPSSTTSSKGSAVMTPANDMDVTNDLQDSIQEVSYCCCFAVISYCHTVCDLLSPW